VVTPGNAGDAGVAEDLIADLLSDDDHGEDTSKGDESHDAAGGDSVAEGDGAATVYGDSAYGTGSFQSRLEAEGIESKCKTQGPNATNGLFGKDRFTINLIEDVVTCPAGITVSIRRRADGSGMANFAHSCTSCALRAECTKAVDGRSISVGPDEVVLARARARQKDPSWVADYRATRPKVERKLAHLMRRRHGGRRARVRGRARVEADFSLLAAAVNLARLGTLGVSSSPLAWTMTPR